MHNKLFIGTRATPDLKVNLEGLVECGLKHIPFEGKEYVGLYVHCVNPTVEEVCTHHQQLIEIMQAHLSHIRADTLPIVVFPQVFLG
jgi:hypothetical protein